MITLPYCFLNTEVRNVLKHNLHRWQANRNWNRSASGGGGAAGLGGPGGYLRPGNASARKNSHKMLKMNSSLKLLKFYRGSYRLSKWVNRSENTERGHIVIDDLARSRSIRTSITTAGYYSTVTGAVHLKVDGANNEERFRSIVFSLSLSLFLLSIFRTIPTINSFEMSSFCLSAGLPH